MIPRKDKFEREPESLGDPARGIHVEKRVEGEAVTIHALGVHTGSPSDIGAAAKDHGHEVTLDVFLLPTQDAHDAILDDWPHNTAGAANEVAFVWPIPAEWTRFSTISVVMIPDTEETITADIDVSVAAAGEAYNADTRQALDETLAIAAGDVDALTEWPLLDVGSLFAGIQLDDVIAIRFQSDTDTMRILGLHIKYEAGGGSGSSHIRYTDAEAVAAVEGEPTLDLISLLTLLGSFDVTHTAAEDDDHALEIDVDAAGHGDVKALLIDYITGAVAAGADEAIILINIDDILAAGGDIFALEVLATEGGSTIFGLKAGVGVGPIHQDSGTFANPTTGTNDTPSTDVPNMIDGDIGTTTSIFVADDDYIIIGAAAAFEEIEAILTVFASGAGIKPTFGYSTAGSHQFTEFSPVDGTNGFRNTGVIAWDQDDLTGHTTNDDTGTFDIKITRTRNSLSTTPVLGFAKTAATTEYIWDKDGKVNLASLFVDALNYAADAEASDTYVITITPGPSAYAVGQQFSFKANTANTGAATLNVNSLGAKAIKKLHDQDPATGDIEAGQIVTVIYDGTNFQMQSQIAAAGGGGGDVATDAIWDAQGDLAKGTGVDTADVLSIGADHTILVSNGSDPSWSAAPPLANIADTGDTNRITLGTSSPHLTLTGNLKTTGTIGVFGSIPDPLSQIMFKINAAQSITDSWDGIFINPTLTSIGTDRRIVGVLGTVINKYALSNAAGIFGLRFGLASWPTATGQTISEQTACLVENAIVNQSTTASTIAEMAGFKTTTLQVTQVSGTMTIGTLYGLHIEPNAWSVATLVFSAAHAIRVEDWTGTSFPAGSTLLEIGTSTPTTTSGLFRMMANFTAAANETPLFVSEGAAGGGGAPTVRQLKTFDPGAGGVNFVGGELVCLLV